MLGTDTAQGQSILGVHRLSFATTSFSFPFFFFLLPLLPVRFSLSFYSLLLSSLPPTLYPSSPSFSLTTAPPHAPPVFYSSSSSEGATMLPPATLANSLLIFCLLPSNPSRALCKFLPKNASMSSAYCKDSCFTRKA